MGESNVWSSLEVWDWRIRLGGDSCRGFFVGGWYKCVERRGGNSMSREGLGWLYAGVLGILLFLVWFSYFDRASDLISTGVVCKRKSSVFPVPLVLCPTDQPKTEKNKDKASGISRLFYPRITLRAEKRKPPNTPMDRPLARKPPLPPPSATRGCSTQQRRQAFPEPSFPPSSSLLSRRRPKCSKIFSQNAVENAPRPTSPEQKGVLAHCPPAVAAAACRFWRSRSTSYIKSK